MSASLLSFEDQIHRVNLLLNAVKELQGLNMETLLKRPHREAWSVIEIVEHLNIAYSHYISKIDQALAQAPNTTEPQDGFSARMWQRWVISTQQPKENKRRWKMKTLRRFEPLLQLEEMTPENTDKIFQRFATSHQHLKQAILQSRHKDNHKIKITSAVGAIVNFYLPECYEFLLSHAERHLVQIRETLGQMELARVES